MTIDFHHFTPLASLLGGFLVGGAVALYALGVGRIAGISGIVGSALGAATGGRWRGQGIPFAFLGGLLLAPWLWRIFAAWPAPTAVAGTPVLLVAGLLVGVGVRMGNGCTSGHGVCGLSRSSLRSLVNVGAFMSAGVVAVAAVDLVRGGWR